MNMSRIVGGLTEIIDSLTDMIDTLTEKNRLLRDEKDKLREEHSKQTTPPPVLAICTELGRTNLGLISCVRMLRNLFDIGLAEGKALYDTQIKPHQPPQPVTANFAGGALYPDYYVLDHDGTSFFVEKPIVGKPSNFTTIDTTAALYKYLQREANAANVNLERLNVRFTARALEQLSRLIYDDCPF